VVNDKRGNLSPIASTSRVRCAAAGFLPVRALAPAISTSLSDAVTLTTPAVKLLPLLWGVRVRKGREAFADAHTIAEND
jgi:hypothetical protein